MVSSNDSGMRYSTGDRQNGTIDQMSPMSDGDGDVIMSVSDLNLDSAVRLDN